VCYHKECQLAELGADYRYTMPESYWIFFRLKWEKMVCLKRRNSIVRNRILSGSLWFNEHGIRPDS